MSLAALLALASLAAANDTDALERFGRLALEARSKACFCETGREPPGQAAAFRLGCQVWFMSQKGCSIWETVPEGTDYASLELPRTTKALSIGYVGHWGSSWQLISYLQRKVAPLLQRGYSVSLDNTACRGMESPEIIARYVASLTLADGQYLDVKANQPISVGKWDAMLGSSTNLWAKVSSRRPGVEYPNCADYRALPCLIQAQENETGLCRNGAATMRLKCCYHSHAEGRRQDTVWMPEAQCEAYKPGLLHD